VVSVGTAAAETPTTRCRVGALSSTLPLEHVLQIIESAKLRFDLTSIDVDVDGAPHAIGRTRIISWPGYTIRWTPNAYGLVYARYMYAGVDGSDEWGLQNPATRDADGARHFLKGGASRRVECVDSVVTEGELLRELASGSPCIMPVVDVARCMWHGTPAAVIIMPLAERWPSGCGEYWQNLRKSRTPFPVRVALRSLRRITQALAHMHSLGIAHRDVKPSNVLYLDDEAYLADVGLSIRGPWTHPRGTPVYMAPEVQDILDAMHAREDRVKSLRGACVPTEAEAKADAEYDGLAADMWSLGITYVEWRSGSRPINWPREEDFLRSVQYRLGMLAQVPQVEGRSPEVYVSLQDKSQVRERRELDMVVVGALLQRDPSKRVSAAGLVALLESMTG
jgi:Protein kinase domain